MKIFLSSAVDRQAVACPPPVSCNSQLGAQGGARLVCIRERGIALVVTLILLTVITFLAVAFLFLSRRERGAVSTAVEITSSRLAAEAGTENAKAQILARIMASGNKADYSLLASTNYSNPLGFVPGNPTADTDPFAVTNVNFDYLNDRVTPTTNSQANIEKNIANLFYSPRVPVFVDTNLVGTPPAARGPLDFRYWLDLNRNGRFEANGGQPEISYNGNYFDTNGNEVLFTLPPPDGIVSNNFVGDPEWVGILERTDRPHGPNNKFTQRFAYLVVPEGKALDINTIHNQSKLQAPVQDGYSRNMGVGPFELNLAAFLVDLNTNVWQWNAGVLPYFYNTNPSPAFSTGTAFEDAAALTRSRYLPTVNGIPQWDGSGWNNLRSVRTLFGMGGANIFLSDFADGFGGGPLMDDVFAPPVDGDAFYNRRNAGWPGADNPNHFFTTQELFDRNKTTAIDAGQTLLNNFSLRLETAGYGISTYDRYTYYRLLSQLGTDTGPEPAKIHLNYRNVDNNGRIIPNAQTNFAAWDRLDFFTNAADRLLRATFSNKGRNQEEFGINDVLSITNVPVLVSNRFVYSPALNRVFQQVANIMDATTNYTLSRGYDFPTVLRPRFLVTNISGFDDIYIRDWVEVDNYLADTLGAQTAPLDLYDPDDFQTVRTAPNGIYNGNLYGVPWIIGAKKGLPNFNEFALKSVAQITRKLQIVKPEIDARPTETNQMFVVGISNSLACEAWNSYSLAYDRPVRILVGNDVALRFAYTNDAQFDLRGGVRTTNFTLGAITNLNANTWSGYGNSIKRVNANSFQIPLVAHTKVVTNEILRMNPPFLTGYSNVGVNLSLGFERGFGFSIPQLTFAVSNRIRFIMLDLDASGNGSGRVIDYVHLNDLNGVRNLSDELPSSTEPVIAGGGGSLGTEEMFWRTNRAGANTVFTPPMGVVNQIRASLGNIDVADWNSYGVGQVSGASKLKEIDNFRVFMGFTPITYPRTINTNLAMQVPFTPTRVTSQKISWQANDPLVHYMAGDLRTLGLGDPIARETPNGVIKTLANIGRLNERYEPWGGYPGSSAIGDSASPVINPYAVEAKDPGIYTSDDWDFPTNKFPSVGWLGRVHRGTPWQTVYLKSGDVSTDTWIKWTGNSNSLDAVGSLPANDRVLFDVFTAAFDENTTRGQLHVNQSGLAAWSAGLSGIIGITNISDDAQLINNPPFVTNMPIVIDPAGVSLDPTNSVVGKIWAGINRTRNSDDYKGSFKSTGDILATPELTVASPLLNTNSVVQLRRGISDALYERLPQMLMGLLRGNDEPRFTIYSYGQALKPANRSIITSGPYSGMCTNYQVTAEFATRTVVRVEDSEGNNPRVVVESFNILPPDE